MYRVDPLRNLPIDGNVAVLLTVMIVSQRPKKAIRERRSVFISLHESNVGTVPYFSHSFAEVSPQKGDKEREIAGKRTYTYGYKFVRDASKERTLFRENLAEPVGGWRVFGGCSDSEINALSQRSECDNNVQVWAVPRTVKIRLHVESSWRAGELATLAVGG